MGLFIVFIIIIIILVKMNKYIPGTSEYVRKKYIEKVNYFIDLYPKLKGNSNINDWIESTYDFFHKENNERDINLTDISKILKTQGFLIEFIKRFETKYLKYEETMKQENIKKEEETIQIIGKTKYFIGLYPQLKGNSNINDWIESTYDFFYKENNERDINLTDIAKILKTQGLSMDFEEFENLYLKYEEKQKKDYLLIKPLLEKFVIQFIDENVYPVGYIINEDTIKAFSLVIKEDVGFEISFSLLQEYVKNERETKELAIYDHFFLIDNPELVDNYDLKFWIKAYLKTFVNNMDYRYYFEKLLKLKKIDIYSTEITAKEIEKQYRISHNEMINEETDKDWMDSFINTQVNEIMEKEHIFWRVYYLDAHFERAINNIYLENLSKKIKRNMSTEKKMINKLSIDDIDIMTGIEFEQLIGDLFKKEGYKIEVTKATGDQGADVIVERFKERTVIQAKRYSSAVSNSAIQEVVSAKAFYNCTRAMVITNNYFTKSAKELASANNVELCNRKQLEQKLKNYNLDY